MTALLQKMIYILSNPFLSVISSDFQTESFNHSKLSVTQFSKLYNLFLVLFLSMAEGNRFQNYDEHQDYTCYQSVLDCCGVTFGTLRAWFPCCCCMCPYPYKQVTQGNVGLIQSFGRFQQEVAPGLHYINPCTDNLEEVPMKTRVIDLQRQLILTKDNITVNIDTIVYYRIVDAKKASYRVTDVRASVCEITYATLRTICGQHTLQDILEKRQEIADVIEQFVEEKVKDWGVYVQQIYIKDMIMSRQLQTDLSMTAKTRRLAQSKIISAQADVEAAKLMRQSADILNSKAAMQIRYLDILQLMSKGQGNKLLFLPLSSHEFDDKK